MTRARDVREAEFSLGVRGALLQLPQAEITRPLRNLANIENDERDMHHHTQQT